MARPVLILRFAIALVIAGGVTAGAGVPVSLFPGVARLAGANSTAWRSSAVLYNATASPQSALLELMPRDGATVSVSQTVQLAPGETREIANLYDFLQAPDGAGMLRVTGTVVTWVRAYNEGNGTFGQDVPAVAPERGFLAIEARLFPLSTPADIKRDFRSNLVLVNLDTVDITVTMTAGAAVGTKVVPAGAYVQINNLGAFLGLAPGFGAVQVSADGRWFGVIATIDPFTGDPTTVRGLSASDVDERSFPGIAQKAGANGAAWRSEAVLYNPGGAAASAQLDLIPRGSNEVIATVAVTLAAGETRRIGNIYDFLGVAEGAGTLHVTGGALAWVRAYNQRPHAGDSAMETFGQDVPPVGSDNAVEQGAFVVLPFQTAADALSGFRSNLVLLNLEENDITVSLRAGGVTKTQAVPAGSYIQIDKLGAFMGMPVGVSCVWATADGRWATAIATIDPTTNDPTTFRPVEGLAPASSYDLIDQALASHAITSEQALTYKVFADFADPRLPAAYAGDDRARIEPSALAELGERFDSLSPATKNLIGPFLVPAYFKGSWWDLRHTGAVGHANALQVRPADTPCFPWLAYCPINFFAWDFASPGPHVRVWYEVARTGTDLVIADDVTAAVENKIWPALTALMGRVPLLTSYGDGVHVDILLGDSLRGDDYAGMTVGVGCNSRASYIVIDRSLTPRDKLYQTVAHELMHAIQGSFETRDCTDNYKWLEESTATWAMDYVYPTADFEHSKAALYFGNGNTRLSLDDMSVKNREYGSYVFFFYLTRVRGVDPLVIRYIWAATKTADQLGALYAGIKTAGEDLDKVWPDFAVYNVNEKPFDDYRTKDHLGNRGVAQRYVNLTASGDPVFSEVDSGSNVELPHLSIRYFQYYAEGDNVSLVAVYNGLTRALEKVSVPEYGEAYSAKPASDPGAIKGAHIDILVRIDGQWQRDDLTNKPARSLCRDLTKERFDSLIIILSNSDISTDRTISPPGTYAPGLLVSSVGCAIWEGHTDLTYKWGKTVTEQMTTSAFHLQYAGEGYGDENTLLFRWFATADGTYSWSGSGTDEDCKYTGNASGSLVHPLDIFQTLAYVTGGLGKRGLVTAGLFYPWLVAPNSLDYTCKNGGTGKKQWSGGSFALSSLPGSTYARVAPEGKSIVINSAKTEPERDISGTWTLQAKRQP